MQVTPQESGDIDNAVAEVVSYLQKQRGIANVNALSLDRVGGASAAVARLVGCPEVSSRAAADRGPGRPCESAGPRRDRDGSRPGFQGCVARRPPALAATDPGRHTVLGIGRACHSGTRRRRDHRHHRIGDAERDGVEPRRSSRCCISSAPPTSSFRASSRSISLRLGIKAGIVGAAFAMLVFMSMPAITELLGGGAVSAVEVQRLIGTGALDAIGYVILDSSSSRSRDFAWSRRASASIAS